ncbi:ABC transporter substrate-binding protein [Piscinibacter sp. XHJ-5]|uniref:ABC transporter substrate-binding protein n=1 Tax=Piscinibacter sp. XHJ-5 TaxID=3037797 RepID=UPI002452912D|nr:ABC transporter substrate-binding protein [Piscinibacter sp. XHJ-5]
MRTCVQAGVLAVGRPLRAQPRPARVVFLNPGESVERGTGPLWRSLGRFMTLAARALDLELEVVYAERDHLLMLRQAEEVARRAAAPDYVVIVNEKMAARQMLESLSRSPAKVLVIHNDLTAEQRRQIGNERQQFGRWIGTAVADNARGGWRLMEELYRQVGQSEPRIIGITGDPNTPVSIERAQGVQQYVDRAGRGRILQLAHGDWSYADGEQKGRVLLARYPDANIIWAANDSMALGALRAVREHASGVRVGGMGGWPDALESIAAGGQAATAAGHNLIGAWAMVLLHDYHHGHDFAEHGGPAQKLDYLFVVHRGNVARYEELLFRQAETLDFRRYSKVAQAGRSRSGRYDFTIERLVSKARGS